MVDCPFCGKSDLALAELKKHLIDDCLDFVLTDFEFEELEALEAEEKHTDDTSI